MTMPCLKGQWIAWLKCAQDYKKSIFIFIFN